MDFNTLPDPFVKAGSEFLKAVQQLGLRPEGLLWAHDRTIDRFVLVLITAQFDYEGPAEIYRLLTLAYRASATPREINPFIIRVHSVNQSIVSAIKRAIEHPMPISAETRDAAGEITSHPHIHIHQLAGDLSFKSEWVYHFKIDRLRPAERSRRWKSFVARVEHLAA